MNKTVFFFFGLLFFVGCQSSETVFNRLVINETHDTELRGIWIASVVNIDWPTKPNLSLDSLKGSYMRILDTYDELNFNAVFVQLRTAGDALYPSQFAPSSRFLTGKEGRIIEYDIVPWLIEETHSRNMEFHAWINPYRATTSLDTTILDHSHVYYTHPEWIIRYGKKYYLNPGEKGVQDHLLQVITELTKNYEIDGVHFDDYFYPYKIDGEYFNDSLSYHDRINKSLTVDDWRRKNINEFVAACKKTIYQLDSFVQFGISPFGVWRNKADDITGSDTRAGQTIYDDLYADSRHWIEHNSLDYIAPQAYWSMDYPAASHRVLVDWWADEVGELPVYMGIGAYKFQNNHDSVWYDLNEVPRQIDYSRITEKIDGFIFFSAKTLMRKEILYRKLQRETFLAPAVTNFQSDWYEYLGVIDVKLTRISNRKWIMTNIPDACKFIEMEILGNNESNMQNQIMPVVNGAVTMKFSGKNPTERIFYFINRSGIVSRGFSFQQLLNQSTDE